MKQQINHPEKGSFIRPYLYVLTSIILLLFGTKAYSQTTRTFRDTTITTSNTYNYNTILITGTTRVTPGTGQSVTFQALSSGCNPLNTVFSGSQNYILTSIPHHEGYNPTTTGYTTCDVMQTVQYIDGLGRPLQTVQVKGNPTASKDVVQPIAYDAFGREATKYLPYTTTSNDGSYKPTAIGDQGSFYTSPPAGVVNTSFPFSQTIYELSPLNRTLEQGAPGNDWQPSSTNANTGSGHTVKLSYGSNITGEVLLWVANSNGNGATGTSSYDAGQLYKTITADENGNQTIEYKDKEGHVVCKKVQSGANAYLSTSYVYDDLGNLSYVIPQIPGTYPTSFTETDAVFTNYIYGYHYDERNRLVQKKIPGKDWEYLVYNQLDQVVLTQDGTHRIAKQWLVTKYDAMGRVILTGLFKDTAPTALTQAQLQTNIYGATQYETPLGTGLGYTATSYPTLSWVFTLNFYDNYTYPGNPYNTTVSNTLAQPTGLLTASKTAVLLPDGTFGPMLWTVDFYDSKGRLAQTYQQHYLNSNDDVRNYDETAFTYNFNDQETQVTRHHYTQANSGSAALTVGTAYAYDHMGRKTKTTEQINGGIAVVLSQDDYNEVGQLMTKHLGNSIQNVSYVYNERGWLTGSSAPLFAMQLNYNAGSAPQWNGNITSQSWGTPGSLGKRYDYTYDQLNRLTAGVSTDGNTENNIGYDPLGNITSLNRAGILSQVLAYSYAGNQLTSVTNNNSAFRSYSYDANGNATSDGLGHSIIYNMLDLPASITGKNLTYTYDATGRKLRKISGTDTTNYVDGIQYDDHTVTFVQTEEGRALNSAGNYTYEYSLGDHLGNTRLSFNQNGAPKQQDDYYPFGMEIPGGTVSSPKNEYLYNKKELQEELTQYDYGARFYDPVIGRFNTIDRYAEKYIFMTPYQYAGNNPIKYSDMNGDSIKVNANINVDLSMIGLGNINVGTASVYYKGGGAYYTNGGAAYDGNDAFVGQVGTALNNLSAGSEGKDLVNDLEASTNTTTIIDDTKAKLGNMTDPANGSQVRWDPTKGIGGIDQTGSTSRPSFIGLGHEFGHVQDLWHGITGGGTWFTNANGDMIDNSDKYATYKENQIRAEHNIPLRTYYDPNESSSKIINSKGNNLYFHSNPVFPAKSPNVIIKPTSIPFNPIKL